MTAANNCPLKILIVDDEAFIRSTLRHMLKAIGSYEIMDAGDGATALTLVQKSAPHIVLCDVEMAPMSGLQFLGKLRSLADPALGQTAVIMLTAAADAGTVSEAMKLGISGYILKPVSARDLRARIEAVLKKEPPRPDATSIPGRVSL